MACIEGERASHFSSLGALPTDFENYPSPGTYIRGRARIFSISMGRHFPEYDIEHFPGTSSRGGGQGFETFGFKVWGSGFREKILTKLFGYSSRTFRELFNNIMGTFWERLGVF